MVRTGNRPIVLLTDFGQQDTFAGVLKGVIASISPESKVIDLTHGVNPQDIRQGSFFWPHPVHTFQKEPCFVLLLIPVLDRPGKESA